MVTPSGIAYYLISLLLESFLEVEADDCLVFSQYNSDAGGR